MKASGDALVIDASVAVKLFIPEEHSDRAGRLFASLDAADPAIVFVPELFFIECANVFRTRTKLRGMSAGEAKQALELLLEFPLERVNAGELPVIALALSLEHDLSVYDACYAALASLTNSTLVTADRKLARKLSASTHHVIWLGDWTG
jgi:predicted nucleic acid-binding protein